MWVWFKKQQGAGVRVHICVPSWRGWYFAQSYFRRHKSGAKGVHTRNLSYHIHCLNWNLPTIHSSHGVYRDCRYWASPMQKFEILNASSPIRFPSTFLLFRNKPAGSWNLCLWSAWTPNPSTARITTPWWSVCRPCTIACGWEARPTAGTHRPAGSRQHSWGRQPSIG